VDARNAGRRRPVRPILPFTAAILAVLLAACSAGAPAATAPDSSRATSPASATVSAPATAPATASPTATAAPSVGLFPLTLTDDEGTSVTIPAEPKKIVSLTPAATETLFALGVGDRVVGRSSDPFMFPPEASPLPEVAVYDKVDVEKVVGLQPDLVIAGGDAFTSVDAVRTLRDQKIPVVVVYAPDVETVLSDIELIGRAAGRPDEATTMTAQVREEMAKVRDAVANLPKPRVFYELDATGAFYGPSDKSFLAEMIGLAGGDPITTGSPDKYDIAAERLIAQDPQVILLADAPFGVKPEDVAKRPGWSVMTAVKNGDIRPIDDSTVTRPGPRLFLGLALLAKTIHPDATIPPASPIPAVP